MLTIPKTIGLSANRPKRIERILKVLLNNVVRLIAFVTNSICPPLGKRLVSLILFAASFAKPKNVYGVGYLSEAVILGYFGSPGFSLFSLNLNGNTTTITNKVMVMVFRAVSKQAFSGIKDRVS